MSTSDSEIFELDMDAQGEPDHEMETKDGSAVSGPGDTTTSNTPTASTNIVNNTPTPASTNNTNNATESLAANVAHELMKITALGSTIHISDNPLPHFSRLYEFSTGLYFITVDNGPVGYFITTEELRMAFRSDHFMRTGRGSKTGVPLGYNRSAIAINADPEIGVHRLVWFDPGLDEWRMGGREFPRDIINIVFPEPDIAPRCFCRCERLEMTDSYEGINERQFKFLLDAKTFYQNHLTRMMKRKERGGKAVSPANRRGNYFE